MPWWQPFRFQEFTRDRFHHALLDKPLGDFALTQIAETPAQASWKWPGSKWTRFPLEKLLARSSVSWLTT